MTDVLTDEAVQFIERHAAEPFFLTLAYSAPHFPFHALEDDLAPFRDTGKFTTAVSHIYGMIRSMDRGVARVLDTLDRLGLAENTIVMFTSDNGPQFTGSGEMDSRRFNCGFAGAKLLVYEGGIRVPMIVRWPARLRGWSRRSTPWCTSRTGCRRCSRPRAWSRRATCTSTAWTSCRCCAAMRRTCRPSASGSGIATRPPASATPRCAMGDGNWCCRPSTSCCAYHLRISRSTSCRNRSPKQHAELTRTPEPERAPHRTARAAAIRHRRRPAGAARPRRRAARPRPTHAGRAGSVVRGGGGGPPQHRRRLVSGNVRRSGGTWFVPGEAVRRAKPGQGPSLRSGRHVRLPRQPGPSAGSGGHDLARPAAAPDRILMGGIP